MKFTLATLLAVAAPVTAQNLTNLDGLLAALAGAGLTTLVTQASILNATTAGQNLLSTLTGNTTLTIFAPNNAAFSNVTTNITSNLAAILDYHIVSGNFTGETKVSPNHTIGRTFLNDTSLVSLEGNKSQVLAWTLEPDGKTHILNQNSNVTVVSTLNYSNILVYVVDAVLTPPGTFADVTANNNASAVSTLLKSIPFIASNGTNTTYFAALDSLSSVHGYTFFAPSDSAIAAAEASLATLATNTTALQAILENHIINGTTLYSPTLTGGNDTYVSSGGENLSVFTNTSGTFVSYGNSSTTAKITQSDVLVDNGVIHVIDIVLVNLATNVAAASSAFASATAAAAKTTTETGPVGAPTSTSPSGGNSGAVGFGLDFSVQHLLTFVGVVVGAAMVL